MNDKKLAQVFHYDLFGKREEKYEFLLTNSLDSLQWDILTANKQDCYFVKKELSFKNLYEEGFLLTDLFPVFTSGIKTHDDNNLVGFDKFLENNYRYDYRPFDCRNIKYDLKQVKRHRFSVMKFVLSNSNLCLLSPRQAITEKFGFFITKNLCDINYTGVAGQFGAGLVFPLYIFKEEVNQNQIMQGQGRIPNLNYLVIKHFSESTNCQYFPEKEPTPGTFAPIDLLDYIYAILHSPTYRAKYKEFLKIDFPRIPYPKDQETFWKFVSLGGELRQIHLLESPMVERFITSYPVSGTNEVGKVRYEDQKVWINENQHFDHVPQVAWDFYIGGYQPAQKWLKDRKGRQLSFEDVRHYQKIIVALTETDRIMKEIDKIEFE